MTYDEAVQQIRIREALKPPSTDLFMPDDDDPEIIAKALMLLDEARSLMNSLLEPHKKSLRSSDVAELIRQEFIISQFLHVWGIEEEVE